MTRSAEAEVRIVEFVLDWVQKFGWFAVTLFLLVGFIFSTIWVSPRPLLLVLMPLYLMLTILGLLFWWSRTRALKPSWRLTPETRRNRRCCPPGTKAETSWWEFVLFQVLIVIIATLWMSAGVVYTMIWINPSTGDGLVTATANMAIVIAGSLAPLARHMAGSGMFNLTPLREISDFTMNIVSGFMKLTRLADDEAGRPLCPPLILALSLLVIPLGIGQAL